MVDLFLNVILFVSGAEVARQIAEKSTLSLKVKQLLFMSQPYSKRLLPFLDLRTWLRMLGKIWFSLFLVLVIPMWLSLHLHHFISQVVDCKYCTAIYVGAAINWWVIGLPLLTTLLYAPLYIITIYLIELIDR